MPAPLAKLGVMALDKRNILIMGGMSGDFEPSSKVFNLDVHAAKFIKKASMRYERVIEGGAFFCSDGCIYIMNGCYDENKCERYNISGNKWELVPSYIESSEKRILINEWMGCIKY